MRSVIVVAFGGKSTEHDVSVITGVLALNALKGVGQSVLPLYIDERGRWLTGEWMKDVKAFSCLEGQKSKKVFFLPGNDTLYEKKKKKLKPIATVRAAMVCLHGKNGEDGLFAAQMLASNVPVSCPPMTESALLMDKWLSKSVFREMGIPVLPATSVLKTDFIANPKKVCESIQEKTTFPVCVKPARLGSSIGISVCENMDELAEGLSTAFRYDFRAVIEPALPDFTEYSVAVYEKGERTICGAPLKQNHRGKILSFKEKYGEQGAYSGSGTGCENGEENAKISEACLLAQLTELSKKVYQGLRLTGVVRVDFLCVGSQVYLNEINTIPGSLSYYYFAESTQDAGAFFSELLQEGIMRFREDNALETAFASTVLSGICGGGKCGKK